MPTIDLTDEELQQLTLVLANASGPGISWMMTNGLLTKVQAAAQRATSSTSSTSLRDTPAVLDGLDIQSPGVGQPGQRKQGRA